MSPEYLKDTLAVNGEVDFRDRSPELTRPPRALKLWLSLRTYGVRRFRAAIAHGIEQAEFAERVIRESEFWEIVTPAQLGMVTFSNPGASREQHANCAAALVEDGFAAVTSSTLHGRPVLRLCTINPRTTHEDIVQTIHRLTEFMSSAATVG
jgi:glutamate/tyrosine decarboxylase-like PLP-dependent enzyme